MCALYIPTSKKNYVINLTITIILTLISGYIIHLAFADNPQKNIFVLVFSYLIFINFFRAMEYVFTKKCIWVYSIFFSGVIREGSKAKEAFYLNLITVVAFEALILYVLFFG